MRYWYLLQGTVLVAGTRYSLGTWYKVLVWVLWMFWVPWVFWVLGTVLVHARLLGTRLNSLQATGLEGSDDAVSFLRATLSQKSNLSFEEKKHNRLKQPYVFVFFGKVDGRSGRQTNVFQKCSTWAPSQMDVWHTMCYGTSHAFHLLHKPLICSMMPLKKFENALRREWYEWSKDSIMANIQQNHCCTTELFKKCFFEERPERSDGYTKKENQETQVILTQFVELIVSLFFFSGCYCPPAESSHTTRTKSY